MWLAGKQALQSDDPELGSQLCYLLAVASKASCLPFLTLSSSLIQRSYYVVHRIVVRMNEVKYVRSLAERLANSKQPINGRYCYLYGLVSQFTLDP